MSGLEKIRQEQEALGRLLSWRKTEGLCRCTECGAMVTTTWRFWFAPNSWRNAVCEPCVDKIVSKEEA